VQRLIFASSIRAQCGPAASSVLDETDAPNPTDAYGRSKLAAEQAIRASNVPFTILRPVLIYGPGVKGNLARLARWARSPWPLPFGSFSNRRSILGRQNLVEAIHFSLRTHSTMGETYVVADPEPLTLAQIIAALFAAALKAIGKTEMWDRLAGELVADPGKLMRAGWRPPVRSAEGLAAMVRADGGIAS
jgi:nucleoside-diphosphate-sugar epimerase